MNTAATATTAPPAAPPAVALHLIGIGAGNPAHLTQEAACAMNAADLILLPRKGEEKAELAALRESLCQTVITRRPAPAMAAFDMPVRAAESADAPYLAQVHAWHDAIARRWQAGIAQAWQALDAHARQQASARAWNVALLVWGDPCLYDSTLRIAQRMQPAPAAVRVVPGITAVQSLAAAHGIALNGVGQPFAVTTGRQLRERGWPAGVDTAVVMLDGQCSFESLPPDVQARLHIWWGACLGLPQQVLESGPLPQAAARIRQARAALRQRHGWVMDTYLLRLMQP